MIIRNTVFAALVAAFAVACGGSTPEAEAPDAAAAEEAPAEEAAEEAPAEEAAEEAPADEAAEGAEAAAE
jgi:hypothetical protein